MFVFICVYLGLEFVCCFVLFCLFAFGLFLVWVVACWVVCLDVSGVLVMFVAF